MKFEDIEARRAEHGIEQRELCRRAAVHPVTYGRWKNGTSRPNTGTLEKVETALSEMIEEKCEAAE